MLCPFCNRSDSQVLESRLAENGRCVRRRRQCLKCDRRFTTLEKIKETQFYVLKKDGRREPFDREKIKRGLLRAVEKRPVSINQVNEVVEEIERRLFSDDVGEIASAQIGRMLMDKLRALDKVAWLRFASVYLQFGDLKDFEAAIEKLTSKK